MEAVLNTIKPIVQELVENELKTLIEQNINEIEGLEGKIDTKLGEVAGKIKSLIIDNINNIPFVPDSIKKGFIDQIPVDQLVTIINGFDLEPFKTTILAIPTTGVSDPAKLNQIRTILTELPDKIKKMLTTHIESIFNGTAIAAVVPAVSPTSSAPTPMVSHVATETSVKQGLQSMSDDDKQKTIDSIMKMLEDTGILDEIKKRICVPAVIATTEVPVVAVEVPDATTDGAVVAVEAPVVAVEAPVVAADVATTDGPVVAVEAPVVAADVAPAVEAPVVAVEAPVVAVEAPVATTAEAPVHATTVATTNAAAPQKGGSRRKTKKNIRHSKRTYTKFGREF